MHGVVSEVDQVASVQWSTSLVAVTTLMFPYLLSLMRGGMGGVGKIAQREARLPS